MALLEHEAQRLADALDDYDGVSVADIGGSDDGGFWVVVHDHRFDLRYEVGSHADYWDFIGALVDHRQYVGRAVEPPPAVGRPSDAATLAAEA